MTASSDPDQGPKGAQSLSRAISVLRAVADAPPHGARLADLMGGTGLSKATTHRLAAALVHEGLLSYDAASRFYTFGAFLKEIGQRADPPQGSGALPADATPNPSLYQRPEYCGNAISLAHLLCDRHLPGKRAHPAMIHESVSGQTSELSFGRLSDYSSRFARVLTSVGIRKGDRVAVMLPKGVELIIAALAIWRVGAVYMPLFSTYSASAVNARLEAGGAKAIVADRVLVERARKYITPSTPVFLVEGDHINRIEGRVTQFWSSIYEAEPLTEATTYGENDPFIMTYSAKVVEPRYGLLTPVRALAEIEQYMRHGLDVRDEDVFWNMTDQGWEYGVFYGLVGPLLIGKSILFCDGPYDVSQGYRVLSKFRVTNLTAAPSQIKAWRRGDPAAASHRLALRIVTVGGEPLPQDIISWVTQKLGVPLVNQYGHREAGMIVGMKHDPHDPHSLNRVSVGRVAPGFSLVVLDEAGTELGVGAEGILAIHVPRSPLFWFRAYSQDEMATEARFRFGRDYYITGDTGHVDADGCVHYAGEASHAISMHKD
ncbi:acetyl-CoA synthetase [Xanthobacter sp. YC-JY1]|nr:acetyl-CoA synthetase [Xanthobacter sp. YC-JY1]